MALKPLNKPIVGRNLRSAVDDAPRCFDPFALAGRGKWVERSASGRTIDEERVLRSQHRVSDLRVLGTDDTEALEAVGVGRSAAGLARADEILEAATDLFFEKGYAQVGVDEIGVTAGLSGPSIYRRFKGKGEILSAIFDQSFDRLLRLTSHRATADPRDDLHQLVDAYANFILNNLKLSRIWIREVHALPDDGAARLRRRYRDYIDMWVEVLQRRYPALTDDEAETAANAAIGAMNSVATWPIPPKDPKVVADAFASFVKSGLDRLGSCGSLKSSVAI
ncbi:TetR/AcrR family transcriptional regulator [Rhodococcus koreensis]